MSRYVQSRLSPLRVAPSRREPTAEEEARRQAAIRQGQEDLIAQALAKGVITASEARQLREERDR